MRELSEILKEIRAEKWRYNKEKGLALAREYSQAYTKWEHEENPDERAKARLRGITRRLGRCVVIWLMDDPD